MYKYLFPHLQRKNPKHNLSKLYCRTMNVFQQRMLHTLSATSRALHYQVDNMDKTTCQSCRCSYPLHIRSKCWHLGVKSIQQHMSCMSWILFDLQTCHLHTMGKGKFRSCLRKSLCHRHDIEFGLRLIDVFPFRISCTLFAQANQSPLQVRNLCT